MQAAHALRHQQGEEHGGEGIVKTQRADIRHQFAAKDAQYRAADPGGMRRDVAGIQGRRRELPAFLERADMHAEGLIRELAAEKEALPAFERGEIFRQRRGHEQMPQVDHKDRHHHRGRTDARPPETGDHELSRAGKELHGHDHRQRGRYLALDGEHAKGETYGHVAKNNGQGAAHAGADGGWHMTSCGQRPAR